MLSDLSPPERELAQYMSELSELAYRAGWIEGLEFDLWRAVIVGPFKYGDLQLTDEQLSRLVHLSEKCGGWIMFHPRREESFIPLSEWKQLVEEE